MDVLIKFSERNASFSLVAVSLKFTVARALYFSRTGEETSLSEMYRQCKTFSGRTDIS